MNRQLKSKLLTVLSPESTAPQAHKDLAANILKWMDYWVGAGVEDMGWYLAESIWDGTSTLRETDGHFDRVNEVNPQAPEYPNKILLQLKPEWFVTP
jgi:hypothetical protein